MEPNFHPSFITVIYQLLSALSYVLDLQHSSEQENLHGILGIHPPQHSFFHEVQSISSRMETPPSTSLPPKPIPLAKEQSSSWQPRTPHFAPCLPLTISSNCNLVPQTPHSLHGLLDPSTVLTSSTQSSPSSSLQAKTHPDSLAIPFAKGQQSQPRQRGSRGRKSKFSETEKQRN